MLCLVHIKTKLVIKVNIIIKTVSPDLLDDFLYYFDNIAFSDNPDWATCYCHFYHFAGTNKQFFQRTGEENRKVSKELILSGQMNGFLAYSDNKPVGWCNVNSRENFAKILYEDDSPDSQQKQIAGIVCFIIGHTHRRQGIARQLLKHTISSLKEKGYDIIESYPRKGDLSDAHSYRGPISLYNSEGFTIYKEFKDFYVMRKNL